MALTDDLISYWKLDEASGNRADSHGSNTLTDNNTVLAAAGKINDAADFESTNSEYLSIADNASLSREGKSFSVTGWFNNESGGPYIMHKVGSFPNFEFAIRLAFNGAGNFLALELWDNGGSLDTVYATTFGALSTSTWYFFWCAVDLTNSLLKISINDGTVDTAAITRSISAGTAAFEIGDYRQSNFHDGLIDEVGLWDRVLTSGEITQLYNSGNGLAYPFSTGTAAPRLPLINGGIVSGGLINRGLIA